MSMQDAQPQQFQIPDRMLVERLANRVAEREVTIASLQALVHVLQAENSQLRGMLAVAEAAAQPTVFPPSAEQTPPAPSVPEFSPEAVQTAPQGVVPNP
jgi:hypothetical protein